MQTSITDYHDPDPDTPTDAKNEIDDLGDAPESFNDADDAADWHQDNVNADDYDEPTGPSSPSGGSATLNVNVEAMQLDTQADGWHRFPDPDDITAQLDTPDDASTLDTQDGEVQAAIDDLTDDAVIGEFLVFDAAAAYEYLETLQKQSDLHLENFHRRQLVVNQLSNGRGLSKGSTLETYDKKWIVQWEVRRRMAERGIEEWGDPAVLSSENRGLPGAE